MFVSPAFQRGVVQPHNSPGVPEGRRPKPPKTKICYPMPTSQARSKSEITSELTTNRSGSTEGGCLPRITWTPVAIALLFLKPPLPRARPTQNAETQQYCFGCGLDMLGGRNKIPEIAHAMSPIKYHRDFLCGLNVACLEHSLNCARRDD